MFCRPEIRRPKAGQIRRPKVEGRKKSETRRPKTEPRSVSGFGLRISALGLLSAFGLRASKSSACGFLSAFGLRVSGLEWPGPTLEPPCRPAPSPLPLRRRASAARRKGRGSIVASTLTIRGSWAGALAGSGCSGSGFGCWYYRRCPAQGWPRLARRRQSRLRPLLLHPSRPPARVWRTTGCANRPAL